MSEQPSQEELYERLTYSLLSAASRMAARMALPLKRSTQLLEMAYFHALRRRGFPVKQAAERLGVSLRKGARLSKLLKTNFLRAERAHELPRRVEFLLWAGPLGERRITQALPDIDPEELQQILKDLLVQGRLRLNPGRTPTYSVSREAYRVALDGWLARIDAADNLIASLLQVLEARFFRKDERAFARSLSLHMRAQDLGHLKAHYEEQIWPLLLKLERAAREAPEGEIIELDLSLLWSPRFKEKEEEER